MRPTERLPTLGLCMAVLAGAPNAGCGGDDEAADTESTEGATSEPTTTPTAGTTESTSSSSGTSSTTTSDGSTTAETSTSSSTGPGSESTGSSTDDTAAETDTGTPLEPSSFALTVDNGVNPPLLLKVNLAEGTGTEVCALVPGANYDSITFTRNNDFYVHNVVQDRLEEVDPCDCGFQVIGPTSLGTLEMTTDEALGLQGLDLEFNAYVTINANTGLATVIGALGVVLDQGGIAWSDADGVVRVLDATADQLLVIDRSTGAAGSPVSVSDDLVTPGLEFDNATNTLYACTGDDLVRIDHENGDVTTIGPIGLTGPCTTLAVPFGPLACLE